MDARPELMEDVTVNDPPLVSVLMSVWNGLPFLSATLDSIQTQTFTGFEFVIVDNVSTDGTREVLQAAAREEPRIKLILNDENLGHSGGLNRGLKACRGDWIARIDADDIALPERLARQFAFVRDNPGVKVASCLAHYINAEGRRIGRTFHDLASPDDFARYMQTNTMIGILHPGAFVDRRLMQQLGGYREAFGAANDIDLWARAAETGGMVLVQQEMLMEYRIHPGQISAAKFLQAHAQYEWARACALARRAGEPEPTWAGFNATLAAASTFRRFDRWRKTRAKYYYREAGVSYACSKRLRAVTHFAAALTLGPSYAIHRVRQQLKWP